ILLSESVHLIWKIRCECAIKGDKHTIVETQYHWIHTINKGLKFDCLSSNEHKFDYIAVRKKLVLQTWSRVLLHE
ncbi:hypothetical protein F5I97DRAFT_1790314, partial [Phlebopus sp. FC_14]